MESATIRPTPISMAGRPQGFRTQAVPLAMRVVGAAVLLAAGALYFWLGGAWWLALVLLLAPDLAFLAFALGARQGVAAYNAAHRPIVPWVVMVAGLVAGSRLALLLALIWIGHIGMDRAAGYGFKTVVPAGRK
jgi:hypothetical protein